MGIQLDVVTNTKKSESDLKRVELAVNGISKSVDSAIGSLKNFASGLVLSAGGLGLAATFVKVSDSISNLDTKLRISTKNQLDYERALSSVNKTAIDTRQSISDVASLYSKLNLNAGELQASQQSIATVTDAISKSIALSGASAETAAAGLSQLAQGLASGQLAGDELRSVLENTPRLARAIADGLGVSIGQLRDLGAAGKLTSKEVFGSILSQTYKLNAEFGRVNITYSQAFQNIRNSGTILFQSFSKAFNKPGSKGLPDFINNIATGITNFAVDIDLKILKLQGNIVRFADNTVEYLRKLPTELIKVFDQIVKYANTKVGSINPLKINVADFIKGLSSGESMVTNWVKKIEYQFFWLYDRVIGNSWIPDLVIGVTSWLGKLAGAPLGAITEFAKLASAAFSSISFQGIKDGLKSALLYASEVAGKINDYFGIYKTRVTYTAIGGVAGATAGVSSSGDPTTITVDPSFWEKMKKSFQKGMESTDRGFFAYVKDINNSIKDFFNLGPNVRGPQRNNPDRPFFHDAINALPIQSQLPVIAAITAGVIGLLYASTSGATLSVLAGLTTTAAGLVVGTSVYDSEIKRVSDKLVGVAHKVVSSIVEALFGSGIFGDKGFGGTLILIAKMALLFKAGRELIGKGLVGAAAAPTNLVNDATTKILARRSEGIYTRNNEELKESTKRLDGFKDSIKRATDDIAQRTYRDASGQLQKVGAVQANEMVKKNGAIPNALQYNQSLVNAIRNSQAAAQIQARDIKNTEEFIKTQSKKVEELKEVYSKLSSQASAASDRFRQGFLNTSSATGGIFGTIGGFKLGEEIAKGMTESTEWEKVGVVIGTTMIGQGVGSAIGSAIGIALLAVLVAIPAAFAAVFSTGAGAIIAGGFLAAIAAYDWDSFKRILGEIVVGLTNSFSNGAKLLYDSIRRALGFKEDSSTFLKDTPEKLIKSIPNAISGISLTRDPNEGSVFTNQAKEDFELIIKNGIYKDIFVDLGNSIVAGGNFVKEKVEGVFDFLRELQVTLNPALADPVKKANGGYISGPGTGRSDSIPAMLSNGEYVVNAKSTSKNRGLLESINSGNIPKFADGGYLSIRGYTNEGRGKEISNSQYMEIFSGWIDSLFKYRNKTVKKDGFNPLAVLPPKYNPINDPTSVYTIPDILEQLSVIRGTFGKNSFVTAAEGILKGIISGYSSVSGSKLNSPNPILQDYLSKETNSNLASQVIKAANGLELLPWKNLNGRPYFESIGKSGGQLIDFIDYFFKEPQKSIYSDMRNYRDLPKPSSFGDSSLLSSPPVMKALGGLVYGPGSSTSDSIPAMLSNGEFVVNAKSASQNRSLLEAINSGTTPKFADGGLVGRSTMVNDPRIVFSTDNLSKKIDDLTNKMGENSNIASFIKLIAKLEGTVSYGFNTGFGNRQITDLSKFPYASRQFDIKTGEEIPADKRANAPNGSTTSAAGLGQIIRDTYDRLSTKLNVNDFGPETQLKMIVELIKERGAYADVITGKFDTAVAKLGDEWEGFKKATPEKINKAIEAVKSGAGEIKDEATNLFDSFKKKLLELLSNSGLDSSIVDKILGFFGVVKDSASRLLGVTKRPAPKSLEELASEVSQNSNNPISKDTLKDASAGVISSFVQTLEEIKKIEAGLTDKNLTELGTTLLKKKLKELTDTLSESVDNLTKPSRLPSKKILSSSGDNQLAEFNRYLGDIGTPLTETTLKGLSPEEVSQVADLIDQFADFSERSAKSSSIMKKSLQSTADNYAAAIKSIVRRNEERLNEKEARTRAQSSPESKQAGEQFANQFHNDVYTGFRNVLLGQSDKPFFRGILDSFTAGIVDNFSKAFIDSLFKNFDVDKIVSKIGSGTFDFGVLAAKLFGTSKKDSIGDNSGSGETPFDLLNGIGRVTAKKPEIQLNELEASFQQGYNYLANVFTNVGSGLSDGLMAIINAIQLAFTSTSGGEDSFFGSIIGAVVKGYTASYGSANMSESFVNVNASGAFADGGVIPGNFGEPKLVVAHGGEVVLNNAQQRALLNGGTGGSQQTFHISITGDVSRQTRAEVLKLIPQIATGVNQANYENGNARR
jgi:tape measure domain-containing protein